MDTTGALPRLRDDRLLRGEGRYVADIDLPDTVHVHFVRSELPHARIARLDVTEARSLPGIVDVLTAEHLGTTNAPLPIMVPAPRPRHPITQTPLAHDRVRYVGEPLAAIVADDRYVAEDAEAAVEIDFEPLAPVSDHRTATEPDATRLHPDADDNDVGSWQLTVGDVDHAIGRADVVVRTELEVARSAGNPMETRGVVAHFDTVRGVLVLHSSTQVPHRIRDLLAAHLGMPEDSVHVVAPDVGGAFGSKLCLYPEEVVCAHLALETRRPVKWIEDRREHFLATAHGRGQVHHVEVAATADGDVLALRDHFVHDNGAYAPYGLRVPMVTATSLAGPYHIPNIDASFVSVFTNKAPVIPYRGAGRPEAVFAVERAFDLLARQLGMEPSELRRRNLLAREAFPHDTGLVYPGHGSVVYDSGDCLGAFEALLDEVDLPAFRDHQARAREEGRHVGIGFASYVEETGTGAYEAGRVHVDLEGRVTVTAGVADQGQGHATTLAQVCAELFDLDPGDVRVELGDTARIPYGVGTWGSRVAVVAGSAVAAASRTVREKATRLAAHALEASEHDIVWSDGAASVAGVPSARLPLAELARAARVSRGRLPLAEGPGLEATEYFQPEGSTYAHGCHAAVVDVEPGTWRTRIRRYVVMHDCGRVINPQIVDGQIRGGVLQGIGGALYEELVYDADGQLLTGSFMDYLIPTLSETPPIELHHRETPSSLNPGGYKGAGEAGTIPVYAAIAAAVEDALSPFGVTVTDVPLTPSRLHRLVSAAVR